MATKSKKVYVKDINESNITAGQQMMFGALPPDILAKANAITFDRKPDYYATEYGEAGEITKKLVKGAVKPTKGQDVKTVSSTTGGSGDAEESKTVTSYTKDLGVVNGINIVATYDENGKLTGFDEKRKTSSASPVSRVYTSDKSYVYPKWDASGKASPGKGYETKGGGLFSDFFSDISSGFDDLVLQNPALRAAAFGAAAPGISSSVGSATGLTGSQLAAATGAVTGGTTAALTGNDVLTGALTGGALGYGASELGATSATQGADTGGAAMGAGGGAGVDLGTATGADLSAAYDMGNVGDLGAGGGLLTNTTGTEGGIDLGGGITINADGSVSGGTFTGSGDSFINAASGAAASGAGAAAAGAGAAGSGLLTGNAITDAALIKGATSLAGGLLQGSTTKDALTSDATARANLAKEVKDMGKFTPVGITTSFGTSNFVTDPVTGAITPSYTLSPAAQAYQNALAGMTSQGLLQGQAQQTLASQYLASQQGKPVQDLGSTLMASQAGLPLTSLGQQYLGESPEAIRQRYVQQQAALLAPGQEQALAGIRTNLANTGRAGLSFGATSDGLAATNPELAAYYNSLANQQRQIAAGADQAAQQQAKFGAGLFAQGTGLTQEQQVAGAGLYGTGLGLTQKGQQFGQQLGNTAFTPFTSGFEAQRAVETAAQQPLTLSTDFANTVATRGAAQGANYASAMNPSLTSTYKASSMNPLADFLQSMSSDDLLALGLAKVIKP